MNIGIINLGCPKNTVDIECMLSFLEDFTITKNPENADVIIINTCGFLKKAREESEKAIKDMLRYKEKNTNLKIIVSGCLVEKEKENLIDKYKDVHSFIGVNELKKIFAAIKTGGVYLNTKPYIYSAKEHKVLLNEISAYVKIADGCNRKCSFCVIPQIKGKYRSRKIDDIVAEIKNLISTGVKEINLISQDSSYYGVDIYGKKKLPDLIEKILKQIKDYFWLRIMYLYPDFDIVKKLIKIMKKDRRLCRYFDIPFQHINDNILRDMKRGHKKNYIIKIIKYIRKQIENAVIRSSFIVGFPGEGKKEYNELLDFIKQGVIDKPGFFAYSDEPGTEAFLLKNKNNSKKIKMRLKKLTVVSKKICYYNNKKLKNKKIECLIVGNKNKNIFLARNQNNAPDVDDFILLENYGNIQKGKFYKVRIN
ncbi:MAG: 30S ribosomal protein S12 methylthiotransferase RimO [Candidatus Goldbacteria bacterium]|nr:30S ribosomal protein S12 methylthiotransferase RimO [Candidatus Goldiibacteriota bacterium]